jgi:hypothetical protein
LHADGSEPWWFESGHDWNLGAAYPHGLETRFRDAQLAPIFGDLDGFVSAAQELQCRGLKRQIETLRRERSISGYVITELNDVQWESNGLMDVQNHPRAFAAIGWPNRAAGVDEAEVLIATRLTTSVREALIAGRKIVFIANSADALIDPERSLPLNDRHNFPMMLLRERAGTLWDGQWMGAFTWRRMEDPRSRLRGGPMLDEHWSGLLPNHVLTGFPSSAFGGLVDAGVAVGWLHHAAAFVKRSFLGKGRLTVSTFDLTSPRAQENPLAPYLLKALAES